MHFFRGSSPLAEVVKRRYGLIQASTPTSVAARMSKGRAESHHSGAHCGSFGVYEAVAPLHHPDHHGLYRRGAVVGYGEAVWTVAEDSQAIGLVARLIRVIGPSNPSSYIHPPCPPSNSSARSLP